MIGSNEKRKLRNVVLTKTFQMRYLGLWFLLNFIFISLVCALLFILNETQWQELIRRDILLVPAYEAARGRAKLFLIGVAGIANMAVVIMAILTTHRLAGPFLALKKVCQDIQQGNRDARLKFRSEDGLADLESSFNSMLDQILKK